MPAQITSGSVIAFLIRAAILVLLTVASLRKYTNEQIFRNAGGFIIGGGAASLALAVYDLIRAGDRRRGCHGLLRRPVLSAPEAPSRRRSDCCRNHNI